MARKYAMVGSVTNAAAKTIAGLRQPASSLASQIVLYYVSWASSATADASARIYVARTTTTGTSTAVTPKPLNPNDPACTAVAGENYTVEPTYTSGETLLDLSGHQRAGAVWYAPPGGEIIIPKTASNGVGLFCSSVTAAFVQTYCMQFYE